MYINDLTLLLNKSSIPVIFADAAIVLITNSKPTEFKRVINETFHELNKWFNADLLSLNFDKTHLIWFNMRNSPNIDMEIKGQNN